MFSIRTFLASAALTVAFALPGLAQVNLAGMITGDDYDRVFEIAAAYGPVERRSDDTGQWLRGEMDSVVYTISFLNCDDNHANCTSVQFRAWWESNGAHTMEEMNQWNRDRRFSAAYLDSNNNATIEFDVNLAGGVTAVNFDDTVQWWKAVLAQFVTDVVQPGYDAARGSGSAPTTPTPPTVPSK